MATVQVRREISKTLLQEAGSPVGPRRGSGPGPYAHCARSHLRDPVHARQDGIAPLEQSCRTTEPHRRGREAIS
jgi:hypothetical protein